ncbi:hypothetical protein MPSEU_000351900 [Mayamaea pseudoterrestris]|nr:hypothetical protein MPSEU_000351900 [Mayamaea pseudoterrestris]
MAATLKELHDKSVLVLTSDARVIVGTFVGHDQVQNLIMNDAHERVYSEDEDVEVVPLGLYVIRGDNVCLIGDYEATKLLDNQRITVPLPEIRQQQY